MSDAGRIVWRVVAIDGMPMDSAFDALVLPTAGGKLDQLGHPTRLLETSVPHESELPDIPLTIVVRARDDAHPLAVDCDILGADGARRSYGRVTQSVAVIVRSVSGIALTGLPALNG